MCLGNFYDSFVFFIFNFVNQVSIVNCVGQKIDDFHHQLFVFGQNLKRLDYVPRTETNKNEINT